ncbi:MAG: hypothetical protein K6A62_03875 [Bacteroidales bacterium]|nr:hypothetical protein [Bacteroidales bacterium]
MPYSMPEGYMDNLQERLGQIPYRRARINLTPYFALAASILILVVAGNFVLNRTKSLAPVSDDAIIEYIIESGTTLAMVEDAY